jgi:hypothetical protein
MQLINAGCLVTTIQKLLGHRRLKSIMLYARVHDRTVAEDYYAAMAQIEKDLDLTAETDTIDKTGDPIDANERAQLLELCQPASRARAGSRYAIEIGYSDAVCARPQDVRTG